MGGGGVGVRCGAVLGGGGVESSGVGCGGCGWCWSGEWSGVGQDEVGGVWWMECD